MSALLILTIAFVLTGVGKEAISPPAGTHALYRVLSAGKHQKPPLSSVAFYYLGSPEKGLDGLAWQLDVFRANTINPLVQLRAVTNRDPLSTPVGVPIRFRRYRLRLAATGEAYDYRSAVTDLALLPAWKDFARYFLPRPARASGWTNGVPRTCEFLGHVLSLRNVDRGTPLPPWENVTVLRLDDEMLIGTGRSFRDREGHRLPQKPDRRNYDYAPFRLEDYRQMIASGLNYFALVPGVERWLRAQPVFYRRGQQGDAPLSYPADFYRSNFLGSIMFEDEPACIMVGDGEVQTTLHWFSDAVELLGKRIQARYLRQARALGEGLRGAGVNFGDMKLVQLDYPVWETRYETAFYQLAAGFAGFVHEGRYRLDDFYQSGMSFDRYVLASTGLSREHTEEEMLRYYYAFLRGAARHFGKHWGTSIDGQADPEVSPLAIRLAHDMGARYVWYWTSDHDHHLPYPEQLELTRELRRHASEHPRRSIRREREILDLAIVLPYGYFPVLESPTGRRHAWDLWWIRELDRGGESDSSRTFRRRMRDLLGEVHKALDAGEDFDITVDDGSIIRGYRRLVRIR